MPSVAAARSIGDAQARFLIRARNGSYVRFTRRGQPSQTAGSQTTTPRKRLSRSSTNHAENTVRPSTSVSQMTKRSDFGGGRTSYYRPFPLTAGARRIAGSRSARAGVLARRFGSVCRTVDAPVCGSSTV
jgi:hypothetical protein